MTTPAPQTQTPKRSHADSAGDSHAGSSGGRDGAKRARRSRWESGDDDDAKTDEATKLTTTPPAKGALSEIVKRLASVVKEKSAAAPEPSGASTSVDAAAARARALAQASILAMGLPVAQLSQSDLAKRVYVGNLYYDLKEDDIRNFFGLFGTIRSVDLSMEPGMTRSKGFCFIEYEDVLAAESAVQVLNGSELSNRSLKVGRPHRGNSSDPNSAQNIGREAIKNVATKCVYVGGVRVELNSHHLQSIFSPFGDIRSCVMAAVSPLESSMHRGYGFLEFADEASAANAIQHMNGFELAGQKLKVGKASPSALLINLALSPNKVVSSGVAAPLATVEDGDVDGVKDVEPVREPAPVPADERCCLCLLNMVNKGDVDDELRDEVQEECGRFGSVERVEVHELDDHVRVFVVFGHADGALKAKKAMHGRFFGGNQVQAAFYPLAELSKRRYRSAFL